MGIITSLSFTIGVLTTNEIIHSNDLDLCGMTLIASRPLYAIIEEVLLTFELLLKLRNFLILLIHQFLKAIFEFLFESRLFLG